MLVRPYSPAPGRSKAALRDGMDLQKHKAAASGDRLKRKERWPARLPWQYVASYVVARTLHERTSARGHRDQAEINGTQTVRP